MTLVASPQRLQRLGRASAPAAPESPLRRWGGILITLGVLGALYATLFPFNFTVPAGMTLAQAAKPFDRRLYDPSDPLDTISNIILFLPAGFSLACVLRGRGVRRRWVVPAVVLAAALLSFGIEFLQQWLPTRESAVSDIVSNTSGGLLGSIFFLAAGVPLLRCADFLVITVRRLLTLTAVTLLFAGCCAYVLWPAFHLYEFRHLFLATWGGSFPLGVGNSPATCRLWDGSVQRVEIASRALPENLVAQAYAGAELQTLLPRTVIASYRPRAGDDVPDLAGHNPPLRWHDDDPVTPGRWLRSTGPMSALNDAIGAYNQFTVHVVCNASGRRQDNFAEIVTLSRDPSNNNFTIGQDGFDLFIRLSSIFAGGAGEKPKMYIPDLFRGGGTHDLMFVYDCPTLRVYVDGPDRCETVELPIDFGGIDRELARSTALPFHGPLPEIYRAAFYFFSFGPLGILLGFLATDRRISARGRTIAALAGLTLPMLAFEFIIVGLCGRSFRPDNILMGLAEPALVMILWTWWLQRHFPGQPCLIKVDIPERFGR